MPAKPIRPETMEPIFVLGRQHSGNTMLATLLGKVPSVLGVTGESGFFEIRRELDKLPPEERAMRTARRIRDDGVRALLRDPDVAQDMSIWREIKPVMKEAAARGATATELYVLGMQQVLDHTGKERWAQKATSYIFLADRVLEIFPHARLIFLARNPFDLAASVAKRSGSFRHTARLVLGWNRGMKIALRLQETRPQNFMLLRYEDLVQDAEAAVRGICNFCRLPYNAAYLDVPHVNKADTPYNETSGRRGLNASRVFYYRNVLTPVQQEAVRLAVSEAVLNRFYPGLLESAPKGSIRERVRAISLLTSSAALLLAEEAKRLAEAPAHRIARLAHRV